MILINCDFPMISYSGKHYKQQIKDLLLQYCHQDNSIDNQCVPPPFLIYPSHPYTAHPTVTGQYINIYVRLG